MCQARTSKIGSDAEEDDEQGSKRQQPDLDKLYKPVGIQVISAAFVCAHEKEQKRKAAKGIR
ncbi:hypothetical protein [Breoghania sp.]|uniref:hypothetical protein n=1 Tax=Breoghania sp. TaxID=2065378 RepID=UPI002631C3C7|nr:hypothetical protein [Breoghania sp.]MDJ0932357.1 hypothetical protein [Breoghania sp.]